MKLPGLREDGQKKVFTAIVASLGVLFFLGLFYLHLRVKPNFLGFWETQKITTVKEIDYQGRSPEELLTEIQPGKTLWDWMELLIVPGSLVLVGSLFQYSQQRRTEEEEKEEIFQRYVDRLSEILIDKNLLSESKKVEHESHRKSTSLNEQEVEREQFVETSRDVVRARTLSILRRFEDDSERKSSVIRFLKETEVISKLKLNLYMADLRKIKLRSTDLMNAQLERVDLREADLSWAYLMGANLSRAKLQKAKFVSAHLDDANLSAAKLIEADLKGASLKGTDLVGADLSKANLEEIAWNGATKWPTGEKMSRAKNIPKILIKELGL